jgi:hypothetical protein
VKRANSKKMSAKKLSSKEAEQGIAEAMQGLDNAASAHAVAPPAPIGVGDRVIVSADCSIEKRRDKIGKITSIALVNFEPGCWVNFGGRAGSDLLPVKYLSKAAA